MTKDTPAGGLPVRRTRPGRSREAVGTVRPTRPSGRWEEVARAASGTRASDPLVVDVGWPDLLLLAALLVGTVVVGDLLLTVDDTVVHLLLAAVGALALDRVVAVAERLTRLPRAAAVAVVVTGAAGAAAALAGLLVPAVVQQGQRIGADAPAVLADLVSLPVAGRSLEEIDVPAQAQAWFDTVPGRLSRNLEDLLGTAALQAVGVVQTPLLLVLLLVEGPALVRAARQVLPQGWRATADGVGRSVQVVVGRYAVGSLLLALLAGTTAFVIGLALAVPLVALVALWAFLWNAVPQLGGVVGGAGLVALALTAGPRTALVALVVWLVDMQVENRVVQPVVVGRAVSLSPLTTMVVALLGVAVAGLLGAVLAIPLVAAVNAARRELGHAGRLP